MESSAGGSGPAPPGTGGRTMTVRGAAFLGVGSMVGAGIFIVTAMVAVSLGSVVALGIFLITSLAALRLRRETGSRTWLIVAAIAATAVVLVVFGVQTLRTEAQTFIAMVAVLALALGLDLVWSSIRASRLGAGGPAGGPGEGRTARLAPGRAFHDREETP